MKKHLRITIVNINTREAVADQCLHGIANAVGNPSARVYDDGQPEKAPHEVNIRFCDCSCRDDD